MAHVDDDLGTGIGRLRATVQQLARNPTAIANRQKVCIETRAVFAIFEDETHWRGEEDFERKETLIELFSEASKLMATKKDSLYRAVENRRKDLIKRDFTETELATCE